MDFEQENNDIPQPTPQPSQPYYPAYDKPPKRSGWRVFWRIFTGMSVLANILLLLMVIALAALFAVGQKGLFAEEVIHKGPRTNKIAVINIQGLIDGQQSEDVRTQLGIAEKDKNVKGLIIRINSPGGTVSASDQIYNEIRKYKAQANKPVIAFMQGVAASGGYYVSVACEKIIAEPTVITGSIGVMMDHFVFQDLLEEKLGIKPVIIKSGEKKDWPSYFEPTTQQQKEYIQNKLIIPAYERFVQLVDDGRETLVLADVRRLSDGSIYSAPEALEEKLIDQIGYFDNAVELLKSMANIEEAHVVEYKRPFSLAGLLSAKSESIPRIDRKTIYELTTPQVLYLWRI